jgi:hypothetical protein
MAAHVASLNGQLQQIRNQMPATEHTSIREQPARRNDQIIEQVYVPTQDVYVSDAESNPEQYATPSGESFEGERQRTQEAVSALDHALATEDTDPHWAPHMEDAIYTAAGQAEFAGGQISNVVCRSSFCRLNIDLTDAESETQFLQEFVPAAGFENVDAFYSREERADGGLAMTVFISREGQPLPGQMRQ